MDDLKRFYLPVARQHVRAGARWAHDIGTDYWLQVPNSPNLVGAAATTTGDELVENGWTVTSMPGTTAGSAGDFAGGSFTKAAGRTRDGVFGDLGIPPHFTTDADGDLLLSPVLFGQGHHMEAAAELVGRSRLPNVLGVTFWGNMSVHSANELDSVWGFVEDGGSPATAADILAGIYTNSTNWVLQSGSSPVSIGPADDALWHKFRIELNTKGLLSWWIDGTLVADTAVSLAVDEFPVGFGMAAGATNRPLLGLTHVYYDWRGV